MVRKSSFLVLALTLFASAGCVYVPPDYYGGPPPPLRGPGPPPDPYYGDAPPDDGMYFGRRGRRDYELPPQQRYPRMEGRTRYLEEERRREVAEADDTAPPEPRSEGNEPDARPGVVTTPSEPSAVPEPPPAPKIDPGSVPVATRSDKAGRVKSPYPPFRELDVTGMASGSLAKDPVSGKVFRLP